MQSGRFFELALIILVLICLAASLSCQSTLKSEEYVKNRTTNALFKIGIKDPNGIRHIWTVSQQSISSINKMLAAYSYETDKGIKFYQIPTWKDTNKLISVIHQDQNRMLWSLFNEVSRLKSRVMKLEKRLSELEPRP